MAGGYEVDVVAAVALQFEHHGCQAFGFNQFARVVLADVVVLAVLAAQVAA